jgi:Pyridoxamine 5'-phosphate oxidase
MPSFENLQGILDQSARRASSFTRTIMPKSMTAQEVVGFVNEERNAIIATTKKDGSPHTAWNPVAYVDNKLYFYSDPHSLCYRNLVRDQRISMAIASGNRAVFVEGEGKEVGQVRQLVDTVLARILSVADRWIPASSYNYSSLAECEASIFEIKIVKVLTYKARQSGNTTAQPV